MNPTPRQTDEESTKAIEEFLEKRNLRPEFKKVGYYHIPSYIIK